MSFLGSMGIDGRRQIRQKKVAGRRKIKTIGEGKIEGGQDPRTKTTVDAYGKGEDPRGSRKSIPAQSGERALSKPGCQQRREKKKVGGTKKMEGIDLRGRETRSDGAKKRETGQPREGVVLLLNGNRSKIARAAGCPRNPVEKKCQTA